MLAHPPRLRASTSHGQQHPNTGLAAEARTGRQTPGQTPNGTGQGGSKEQLRRRREERERARNIALRGEAFYTASQAGGSHAALPAKLDFHQARQMLAEKRR